MKRKPECPECGSKNILTSVDGNRRCRVCGHTWDKAKKVGAK